jgi:hypothetical protein
MYTDTYSGKQYKQLADISSPPIVKVGKYKYFQFRDPVLFIRTARPDLTSRKPNSILNNDVPPFKYPKKGMIECPDYRHKSECGYGMHGVFLHHSGRYLINYLDKEDGGNYFLLMETGRGNYIAAESDKMKCGRANVLGAFKTREGLVKAYLQYNQTRVKAKLNNQLDLRFKGWR